ncbi:MAG: glycosyltransferase family 39 protein [Roseiflexaceae bacterium]
MSFPTARRLPIDPLLLIALLVALLLRALLWGGLPRTGMISDEGEYFSAAAWLAQGREFSWYQQYLWTRAPVYPLFLAAHRLLFGDALAPVYLSQMALSLLNVALVYALAGRVVAGAEEGRTRRLVPFLAALLMGLYFPFAVYPQVLLSETLYITLMLGAFLALLGGGAGPRRFPRLPDGLLRVALAGGLLGLATLTRSLTLGFLPLAALWLLLQRRAPDAPPWRPWRGLSRAALLPPAVLLLCAAALILPWTVYNSRAFGGLVLVDTTGAYNLMLGARTASDGRRSDAPPRNFALALMAEGLAPPARAELVADSCLARRNDQGLRDALAAAPLPQARRQQLMTAEGLCLIAEKPLAFAQKSLGELLDFFQINYSGDERFTDGFTLGRLPPAYTLGLFLLDDTLYVLVLPLAVVGFALHRTKNQEPRTKNPNHRRDTEDAEEKNSYPPRALRLGGESSETQNSASLKPQASSLIGLWWLYTIATAPLLFAINRFRLPLLPFALIFAACALVALPRGWAALRTRAGAPWAALAALLLLVATTPYAYVWPPDPARPELPGVQVSYLGPFPAPSSVSSTRRALAARPNALRVAEIQVALRAGDAGRAQTLLDVAEPLIARSSRRPGLIPTRELIQALIDGTAGRSEAGLARLPAEQIVAARDVEAAVVRGDLLRSLGRTEEARAALGGSEATGFVDDANPVQWAWDWLRPAPTRRIDLAGDLDLGYVVGCYLGEGDTSIQPPATFRWCGDGARLRFPAAGNGRAQTLVLRADARAWAGFATQPPLLAVLANNQPVGNCALGFALGECSVALLPMPPGSDLVITLRTPTFIAPATRYVSQQGSQVGQAQRLGVRLDWAELREAGQ